ncbi:unnamed protein product, partial [Brachionus calyciflorus]
MSEKGSPVTPSSSLFPSILGCFEYNSKNLNSPENLFKCKGCSKNIAFTIGDPTSNLHHHITKNRKK